MATPYATKDDLALFGLNQKVLDGLTPDQQDAALEAASDLIDSYLNSKFKLPLVSWGKGLTQKVCEIAAWTLLSLRGFDPEDMGDIEVKNRYDLAQLWLHRITTGEITPIVTDGNSPQGEYGGPNTLSSRTQPTSQPSPGGLINIDVNESGGVVFTEAPRHRGWK